MAKDAAEITPKFVPLDHLYGRDNSGGKGFSSPTADFGDGGKVTGSKGYLSASGGSKSSD
jgi:hypothetical protein